MCITLKRSKKGACIECSTQGILLLYVCVKSDVTGYMMSPCLVE